MGDMEKALTECRKAQAEGREITDACARVIASMYHGGQWSRSYSLASTGNVGDEPDAASLTMRDLFGNYDSLQTEDERLIYNMMGTYLVDRTVYRKVPGPIEGWSQLWL